MKVFVKKTGGDDKESEAGREAGRLIPVTATLRHRTHEQNARYLEVHCAPLHELVIGTITRGNRLGVMDID